MGKLDSCSIRVKSATRLLSDCVMALYLGEYASQIHANRIAGYRRDHQPYPAGPTDSSRPFDLHSVYHGQSR